MFRLESGKKKYNSLSLTAKASLWSFVASIIQKGMNVLATPIFTRLLETDEFAQYSLYQAWFVILLIISSLQVFNYSAYTAFSKYEGKEDEFVSSAVGVIFLLSIIIMAVSIMVNNIAGNVIGLPLHIIILMFVDIIFYSCYNLWMTKERFNFRYKLMTIVSIIMGICEPILGICLINEVKNRGYGRIYGTVVIHFVIGLVLLLFLLNRSHKLYNNEYWKHIFSFGIPLLPHLLSTQILGRADRIMINNICGASDAGIYSLAYGLSMLMIIVNDAILASLTPWTYKSIKNGKKSEISSKVNSLIMLVCAANLMLILFAPEAIHIFATKEYFNAIYIIPATSASVYYMFLFNLFANIEYYYSETKFVAIASIGAAVANIVLNLIFIPKYGFFAAGYTTLISYVLYSIGHFCFMNVVSKKHDSGFSYYNSKYILMVSVIFSLICMLVLPMYKYYTARYLVILVFIIILFAFRKKIISLVMER